MKTHVVVVPPATAENAATLSAAVSLLQKGEIVALPTETVYGLAGHALNPEAVARIFEVKHRPRFDPLIVHLPGRDWLERIARVPEDDRALIEKLIGRFWPGPFTIVLPRRSIVPDLVTGGQETVAVRMSSHRTFIEIIRAFGQPLAAPSANRFGRISPTTAQHVLDELDGRIPLIVDAGPTAVGIESTIVRVQKGKIEILRPGSVTAEELSAYGEIETGISEKIVAPGQLPTHYAPRTPLRLIGRSTDFLAPADQRVGLLAWNPVETVEGYAAIRELSRRQDLREAAANLFRYLRELDALSLDLILAEEVPDQGLGAAIMDRLRRAAEK